MYEAGKGVQRDYIMAFVWYDVAVANGHKKAHRNRNHVQSKLDEDELKKAQALAITSSPTNFNFFHVM